ncbi:hypothetical protein CIB84_015150 [Bambusicola thoracicus]|uniref:Uncharacterized protein n=1 Tax=Bambusicola thoracicus TaxID=9083 RepID=A0A2P4SAF8_BAMTH|nr:hypothetical protein CIB84_015150 [Bambusicola thoracicus]
MLHFLCLQLVH